MSLGRLVIENVWQAQQSGEQLSDARLTDRLSDIATAHSILKRASHATDVDKALAKEDCSHEDKAIIRELVQKAKPPSSILIDYAVNVVLSNDAVFRSLTPRVELRIKGVAVEAGVDELSRLRYEVARAIHRLQHYQH